MEGEKTRQRTVVIQPINEPDEILLSKASDVVGGRLDPVENEVISIRAKEKVELVRLCHDEYRTHTQRPS